MIDWNEFRELLEDDLLRTWASTMDIDTDELEELFNHIDDGDGNISSEEFVAGVMKMKGQARSADLIGLCSHVKRLDKKLNVLLASAGQGHWAERPFPERPFLRDDKQSVIQ